MASTTGGATPEMHAIHGQQVVLLQEEMERLEQRVMDLQEGVGQLQTDNSVLKVKAILTLGNMKLQIDSLEEDRQFLIEKLLDMEMKLRESREDLASKVREVEALKATRDAEKRRNG